MLGADRVHVQQDATATDASLVIQVGGNLYVSDASLSALWAPAPSRPGECPFPGLDAFGPGQARWFFGREKLTGDLLAVLDEALRTGSGGPVLVVGPSGAGKSSLLGAGLMAGLTQGRLPAAGSDSWPRMMFTPGARPLATLREALATCARVTSDAAAGRAVIVVDQLEEIFTACDDDTERAGFLRELAALASAEAVVVLGLRADFYARATSYPVLRSAMGARQVVLGAMSAAEVRQAITLPALDAGLTLDDGLAERLMRDLGVDEDSGYEPGRLPLLAHSLRATWQRRDGDRLTVAAYETTGGIGAAIAKTAEDVYADLDDDVKLAARQVFLSLVRVGDAASDSDGEGTADTRRRVSAETLYAAAADEAATRAVVAAFTAARLLTSGDQTVQITHEALLTRWPRLREWIGADRVGNLIRQSLEEAAATWDREGRDPSGLYAGGRLAAAQARASDTVRAAAGAGELSRVAREFLAASDRRRHRGVRRRNAIIALLTALSVALGALVGFANDQRVSAQKNEARAQANARQVQREYNGAASAALGLASSAALANDDPGPAMQFAVDAWRLKRNTFQAVSALLSTQAAPYTGRLYFAPATEAEMYAVAFSPDGSVIATGGNRPYLRLWSATSYRLLTSVPAAPDTSVWAVAFSPDGRTLAAAVVGGVRLWHVIHPARLVPAGFIRTEATNAPSNATQVAFGPGGRTLAVADSVGSTSSSVVGSVQLWNLSNRTLLAHVATKGVVDSIAFAARGRDLAVGVIGGAIELWDLVKRDVTVLQPAVNDGDLGAVAATSDGHTVAFATNTPSGTAQSIKLWSLTSHRVTTTVISPDKYGSVSSLAFSPDGRLLAAGDLDKTVRVWDLRALRIPPLLGEFSGSGSVISQVAFSPDGASLASASFDGTVALWDTRGNTLGGAANSSLASTFSPDGRLLAVGVDEASAKGIYLFSMPSRQLDAILPTGGRPVGAIAFSPDGQTLAAALTDAPIATVRLWHLATRRLIGQIQTGERGLDRSIAFSPDGRMLATSGDEDPNVRLWDTTRLSLVAALNSAIPDEPQAVAGASAIAFSPDGRFIAVACNDNLTVLYSVARHTLYNVYQQQNAAAWSVAFSPDGTTLAAGAQDGGVYLFRVKAPARRPSLSSGGPYPVPKVLIGGSQLVSGLAYTTDGYLISTSWDGTIRLWNAKDYTVFGSIAANAGTIAAMSYSASTGLVATAGNVTQLWEIHPGTVATQVCRTLRIQPGAGLTVWNTYLPPQIHYIPACP